MSDCINHGCGGKQAGVCLNDLPGVKCYGYEPPRETNADRIRAMTDEELAETMLDCFAAFYEVEWSKQDILDWLKEEAEEGE